MREQPNPYAPPKHDSASAPRVADEATARLEAIRREHINAETNVKTLSVLFFIGAFGLLISGLGQLTADAFAGSVNVAFGAALGLSGYWLRSLDKRGRLVYSIIVALTVVGVLLGRDYTHSISYDLGRLFWPLLFLAILWGAKASTVMTAHYRDVVIPATPHVKRKVSLLLIVLLVLLLAAVIFAVLVV